MYHEDEIDLAYAGGIGGLVILIILIILAMLCLRQCAPAPAEAAETDTKILQLQSKYQEEAQDFINWVRATYPEHKFIVAEVYRTQERQDKLFKNGPTTTTVRISKHTLRKAMDLYFVKAGKVIAYEKAPYKAIGDEWANRGNTWGGNWKVPFDPGHFEFK